MSGKLTPDPRVIEMLRVLDEAGGIADASDYPDDLLRDFYDDRGRDADTFNIAMHLGLTNVTHSSDFDTSTATITPAGRALLTDTQQGAET